MTLERLDLIVYTSVSRHEAARRQRLGMKLMKKFRRASTLRFTKDEVSMPAYDGAL